MSRYDDIDYSKMKEHGRVLENPVLLPEVEEQIKDIRKRKQAFITSEEAYVAIENEVSKWLASMTDKYGGGDQEKKHSEIRRYAYVRAIIGSSPDVTTDKVDLPGEDSVLVFLTTLEQQFGKKKGGKKTR